MKIYFTGAISGGREYVDSYAFIVNLLKEYGNVLTCHIADKNLSSFGENLDCSDIYNRDVNWLKKADVLIAEVTTPSLGVGYEISYFERFKKPILCLFNQSSKKRLSSMINGNNNLEIKKYNKIKETHEIIKTFFEKIRAKTI